VNGIFNLVLAGIWLVLGLAFLLLPVVDPDGAGGRVNPLFGWVGLVLCVYNLARWWVARQAALERQVRQDAHARRRVEEAPRPDRPPDPNFDFTDRADG
jgi:hypothetical protein